MAWPILGWRGKKGVFEENKLWTAPGCFILPHFDERDINLGKTRTPQNFLRFSCVGLNISGRVVRFLCGRNLYLLGFIIWIMFYVKKWLWMYIYIYFYFVYNIKIKLNQYHAVSRIYAYTLRSFLSSELYEILLIGGAERTKNVNLKKNNNNSFPRVGIEATILFPCATTTPI